MEGEGDRNRLPTFKCPRDLTLAGKVSPSLRSRKTFVPNIPPKRDRTTPSASSNQQSSSSSPGSSRARDGRQAQRGREKKKPELVQSSSIFSEGIGDERSRARFGSRGRGSGSGSRGSGNGDPSAGDSRGKVPIPVGPNASLEKFFRARDEAEGDALRGNFTFQEVHAKVHEMIGDGKFISDLKDESETVDKSLHPVELPMASYLNTVLAEMKSVPIKLPLQENAPLTEVKIEPGTSKPDIGSEEDCLHPFSFAHTLLTAPPEGTIVFIQMPDSLPHLDSSAASTEIKEPKLSTDIEALPEGCVGKIQILASGESRLLMGENVFEIRPAKPVSFRQELVAIDLEEKMITALGPVKQKFLCTPDIEQLFRQSL